MKYLQIQYISSLYIVLPRDAEMESWIDNYFGVGGYT